MGYKILNLKSEEWKRGDIVINGEATWYYIILEWGETFIHSHKWYKVFYVLDNEEKTKKRLLLEDNVVRKVIRFD